MCLVRDGERVSVGTGWREARSSRFGELDSCTASSITICQRRREQCYLKVLFCGTRSKYQVPRFSIERGALESCISFVGEEVGRRS